jgi:Transposase DDE domain/Polyketide cyclase / dehydrase and lipid transport
VIDRPRAAIAAYAADPDNATKWYSNIRSVEWKTPKPLKVGTRMAFVAHFMGRRLSYTYEVRELVAGERFVMSTRQGPFPMETTYSSQDSGPGSTRMELRNRGEPWVAADEAYGQNTALRDWLEERGLRYVLAVPKSFPVMIAAGSRRADDLAALVPAAGWQQISCGDGAKGPRFYDWALIATGSPARHLLVRRSLTPNVKGERELAFFTCHAPGGTALAELVRVAGARWTVEECFQAAKNETGLDHYQVRRYDAWYRHITLSMLALAFLQVTAAQRGHQHLWTTFPNTPAA